MTDKALILAIKYLSRASRSEGEVVAYLTEKGVSKNTIDGVIRYLKQKRFIDDKGYTFDYIERMLKLNRSSLRITDTLEQKGIDKKLIESGLKKNGVTDKTQYRIAEKLFTKKLKNCKNKKDEKALFKVAGYLAREGFTEEIIELLLEKHR